MIAHNNPFSPGISSKELDSLWMRMVTPEVTHWVVDTSSPWFITFVLRDAILKEKR